MMAVTFNPELFKQRYPEFAGVSGELLGLYFDESTLIVSNTDRSRVKDEKERRILLWLLVAHKAQLASNKQGGLVGRIASASEGSVSVSTDMGPVTNTQAWYIQTQYGAEYWNATAKYRTMQYITR
ncbi:MAG: DUF4054 domain-containing protein [Moraxellaceae bacterium]|nr:MAG: DUF4054 domain-containing protein [Moraxellaceae bacterium]